MGHGSTFCYQDVHEIFVKHAALSAFENGVNRNFNIGRYRHMNKDHYDALIPT